MSDMQKVHASYGRTGTVFFAVAYLGTLFLPLWVAGVATLSSESDYSVVLVRFFTHPVFEVVWPVMLVFAVLNFIEHRPLTLNGEGVTSYAFGRRWRRIPWGEMKTIRKKVSFEYERGGLVTTLIFIGRGKVYAKSYMHNFDDVRKIAGLMANEHGIPIEVKVEADLLQNDPLLGEHTL